jgi:coiled-coil domain-containing protein 151
LFTLRTEGQKKAYVEEWEEQKKEYTNKIKEMKQEIKELTAKLTLVQNPNSKKDQKIVQDWTPKIHLPPGAKSAQEAVDIIDLQLIDYQKKIDLVNVRYNQRQEYFNRIVEEYHMLLSCKNGKTVGNIDPPETFEEDSNRKLITFLENEIHQKSVQWMEGEHIRKKYRGIKLSLMNDSEKFESSLLELEKAIIDQEAEISKLEVRFEFKCN